MEFLRQLKILFAVLTLGTLTVPDLCYPAVFAASASQTVAVDAPAPASSQASTPGNLETADDCATKEQCQALLDQYEKLLTQYDSDINKTAGQKKTLQNQISLLKQKAQSLAVQIKQSGAVINDLSLQISDTDKSVQDTESKIEQDQANLSEILRSINQEDQRPLIELVLAEPRLSSFFDDVVYLENLNEQSDQILQDVKDLKSSLEDQKAGLESDKSDMEDAMQIQTLQKQEQEKNQAQQEQTLKLTESQYQNQLSQKKATETEISKIKNKIFQLAGLGANQETLTFGDAVILAKKVADIAGIRPAFLLAILTQESNIGQNVGQCYLTNNATGSGVKITTGQIVARVMNPARDVTPYLSIVAGIGRDPASTRLSCPMQYGWGGAMGPAQFIPSTWTLYTSRISAITGSPADPWKNNDAFLAAALYVGDYGAKNKDYNDEWKAAMIYFSGSTNKKYRFYGDNVVAIEKGYESDMATIGQ